MIKENILLNDKLANIEKIKAILNEEIMIYTKPIHINAHQDRNRYYYNHSYDRETRLAICCSCGEVIGEQNKYIFDDIFYFCEKEKEKYRFCPYCGERFDKR